MKRDVLLARCREGASSDVERAALGSYTGQRRL
jgi:hypothetical protein